MQSIVLSGALALLCAGLVAADAKPVAEPVTPPPAVEPAAPVDFDAIKYDRLFRKYTQKFFGDAVDWRIFKSQAIVESRLEHDSQSERGAVGVMQIRRTTFEEIQKQNPFFRDKDLSHPEWNIAAGIYYNRYLYDRWRKQRGLSDEKRFLLMLASYNAGYARIATALAKAGNPRDNWEDVQRHVPRQTREYVIRVHQTVAELVRDDSGERKPVRLVLAVNDDALGL